MKITLLLFSLLISSFALSQKEEITFGEFSSAEIDMTNYEKDANAKAVILYDKGESVFIDTDDGYDIQFTRHKRIKIFDRSAGEYSVVSIPYYVDGYGKTEIIKSIEAFTYNAENGVLKSKKLDPSTIYEERVSENWFNKKFIFPDVQDGSILEYRYILETSFHFNLPDWTFQDKIPTIYSEYEVRMIPFYEYIFIVQGTTRFDFQNSVVAKETRTWGNVSKVYEIDVGTGVEFQDNIHTFILKDIPAFEDELYITSVNDYIIKMDFQLAKIHFPTGGNSDIISTWYTLNDAILKHARFGKYLKNCDRFAKKIIEGELNLSGLDENKKAEVIIEYVKNNFEWNGYNSKYASQTPKQFINQKNGNSADINLLLIALLNEAGIKAEPIILSTRDHGKISIDYPFEHFTNYVILYVNTNLPFLTDGTENLLPYNRIPTKCLNEKGLVVNQEPEPRWIDLSCNILSIESHIISLSIDTLTLDTKASVTIQATEYESLSNRNRFKNDTTTIKDYYSNKIGKITQTKTVDYHNTNLPYSIHIEGIHETEKIGENIVIKPFLNLPLLTNILTQKERSYPVDFVYPWGKKFESQLDIPIGFSISSLPDSYEIEDDLAEIRINYSVNDDTITAKGNYKLKKSSYVAREYSRIKNYLDQVVEYFNQPIVLEIDN